MIQKQLNCVQILLISFFLISLVGCVENRKFRHARWQEEDLKLSEVTDVTWYFCDVKCTYLQVLFPAYDFVVVYFQGIKTSEKFGVCYIKIQESYILWNKLVQNEFYNRTCGQGDIVDYYKLQDDYKLKAIMGIGKGNQLPEKYNPF